MALDLISNTQPGKELYLFGDAMYLREEGNGRPTWKWAPSVKHVKEKGWTGLTDPFSFHFLELERTRTLITT